MAVNVGMASNATVIGVETDSSKAINQLLSNSRRRKPPRLQASR
jgi:hypothetical protein